MKCNVNIIERTLSASVAWTIRDKYSADSPEVTANFKQTPLNLKVNHG